MAAPHTPPRLLVWSGARAILYGMALARTVAALALLLAVAACSWDDGKERHAATSAPTATLTADPGDVQGAGCPENRLWTSCPAADWVARIAEHAGFVVTGDTQSALTVEGDGPSFYFWATPLTAPVAETAVDEGWRPLGRSAGVDVYGDGSLYEWWVAQGHVLWTNAGPTRDSRLPTLAELAPLIRASRELAAPAAK
jgi:hypothetical protein